VFVVCARLNFTLPEYFLHPILSHLPGLQVQGIEQTSQLRLMCDLQLPCEHGTAQGVQNFGSLNAVNVVSANWKDDDLVIDKQEHVVTLSLGICDIDRSAV
jgi:hypothetical protein